MATLQIRIDDDLKSKADDLFKELGTDTTTAVRMFLTQAVDCNGFPFEIKKKTKKDFEELFRPLSEEELLARLAESRQQIENGQYRKAEDVISDIRKKYGL